MTEVCTSAVARAQEAYASRIVYLVLLIACSKRCYIRNLKLDMVQNHYHDDCKWIAYGADGSGKILGGKGCTCARSCTCPLLGMLSESLAGFHGIVRNLEGCAVTHRSIRE